MAHELGRARRAAALALACLGGAGLALVGERGIAADTPPGAAAGACVVSRIGVGYDVDYVAALGGYGVTAASLTDVPPGCEGRELALTLRGAHDQPLAEARAPLTSPTASVPIPGPAVAAAEVSGTSVALVTDAARS